MCVKLGKISIFIACIKWNYSHHFAIYSTYPMIWILYRASDWAVFVCCRLYSMQNNSIETICNMHTYHFNSIEIHKLEFIRFLLWISQFDSFVNFFHTVRDDLLSRELLLQILHKIWRNRREFPSTTVRTIVVMNLLQSWKPRFEQFSKKLNSILINYILTIFAITAPSFWWSGKLNMSIFTTTSNSSNGKCESKYSK